MVDGAHEPRLSREEGMFIHPVAETAVLAGNATIGAEILEELPSATRWSCRSAAAD